MSLTMISSNIAGYTKKQLTAAVVFIGFCIGNAVGPQTFINSQARMYSSVLVCILWPQSGAQHELKNHSNLPYSL